MIALLYQQQAVGRCFATMSDLRKVVTRGHRTSPVIRDSGDVGQWSVVNSISSYVSIIAFGILRPSSAVLSHALPNLLS